MDDALLKRAYDWIEHKSAEHGYGFYRPSNPHEFFPDAESCSDEEIAAHKAACDAYDRGEYKHDYSGCVHTGKMHILVAPWGIGGYVLRDEEAEDLLAELKAAMAPSGAQEGEG